MKKDPAAAAPTPDALPHTFAYLLEAFGEWLLSRGFSSRTARDYPDGVRPFLLFLHDCGEKEMREVVPRHFLAYHAELLGRRYRGRALSIRTVGIRLSQMKAFFRFLLKTSRIHYDPAAAFELPRRPKTLPRGILEVGEARRLLDAPDLSTPLGLRDRAILELLYSSGLRNSELRNLTLSDLDLEGGVLFVRGKGSVEAYVPFGEEAKRALKDYLAFGRVRLLKSYRGGRPKTPRTRAEEAGREYVFLSKNGHRLDLSNLWQTIRAYGRRCGFAGRIGPHSLRHTCATHLLKGGADIRHIQALLRHKDVNTTQIYTRVHIEDLKEAQRKYHPRERKRAVEEKPEEEG